MAKGKKKKKGKSRKQRLNENQKFRNMSAQQLISKGDVCLKNLNVRDAISAYKQARTNKASSDVINPKLFHAYLLRFKQLKGNKMVKEADVVLNMTFKIFSDIPVITPAVLKDCVLFFPVPKSVEIYNKFIKANAPVAQIEKDLGNRLVAEDSLCLAHTLTDESKLKRDVQYVQSAVKEMEAGEWEKAFQEMRAMSRKSPYSDMKIFAKAMVSYIEDDSKTLGKALCMLGDNFPFSSIATLLKEYAENGTIESHKRYPLTAVLLMDQNIHKQTWRINLENAVDSGDIKKINQWIKSLSEILLPKNPEKAKGHLLEIIGSGIAQTRMNNDGFMKLLKTNIPSETRRNMLFRKTVSSNENFLSFYTVPYLENIANEFPDKKDRQTAKSIILLEIIKSLKHDNEFVDKYFEELVDIFDFFNMPQAVLDETVELIIFQIAKKVMDLDQKSQAAYDIILDLPIELPAMKKPMEYSLMKLVDIFCEDHFACLKLAQLFYLKNAFRKAENILSKAYERAPHDIEVKEKYALSLIIASVRNLEKKNFNLANNDLKKAEKFNVNSLKIFIAVKKLFSHAVETKKFSKKLFDTETKNFSLNEKIKTLLLFKLDMEGPKNSKPVNARGFATIFNFYKKKVKTLSSSELFLLFKPIEETYHLIFRKSFFASSLIRGKGQLLARLNDSDFTNLIIEFVQNNYIEIIIKELKKRKKTARANLSVIFDFYYTALCHFRGGLMEFSRIEDITARADDPLKEQLRKISRELSKIAPYYLKQAFELFDFQTFEPSNFFSDMIDECFEPDMSPDDWMVDEAINRLFTDIAQKHTSGHLEDFKAKNVFGENCDEENINNVIFDLVDSAVLLINNPRSRVSILPDEFRSEFGELILLVKNTKITSPGEFRQMGRKFAAEFEHAKVIVQALDRCKSSTGVMSTLEAQHFIMGMRSEI